MHSHCALYPETNSSKTLTVRGTLVTQNVTPIWCEHFNTQFVIYLMWKFKYTIGKIGRCSVLGTGDLQITKEHNDYYSWQAQETVGQ